MLTDLIKVNLQREVPFDQQVAYLTSLQTQHLNSIDKFGKQDSGILHQSNSNLDGDHGSGIVVGDTQVIVGENKVTPGPKSPEQMINTNDNN